MKQGLTRVRLKSLSDIHRIMGDLFRKHTRGELSDGQLSTLSQHLNRLHSQLVAEREIDVTEELAVIEEKLLQIQSR